VNERVAVHTAETQERSILQPGDHPKNTLLILPFQLRLEADQVEGCSFAVLVAQLNDRVGDSPRAGIFQPNRLQRPMGQRLPPSLGHFFHGRHPSK
jgi:hypothetical protein